MPTISFNTANFVARALDYHMTEGWGQGERSTQAFFRPLDTYHARLDALLAEVQALGFSAIDLWTPILHPDWATPDHHAIACGLLRQYGFEVASLCGWFGSSPAEFEAACQLAAAVGTRILGGGTSMLHKDRAFVVDRLNRYDLVLAVENHPEKTPAELLAKIGDGAGGRLAVTVDTGWFGTQGYDAAQAIEALAGHIALVHLKDVLAAGAHDTCRYGLGVVPVEACVRALQRQGYRGPISVEHEPEHFSPVGDIRASLALLRGWLAEA